ncbi:thioredoxin-like protein [Cokeromyces recurvatus]|uniref:thioredoxin-like protein n=1 Tax=Cokeromyces recurvatus TaxID=90255 RepID=UPI00221E4DAA|nr:thioredoxin-like protein [Cokeromyces recurvatus]KAI7902345.1 thioredoxin-like protein [Cokeromyces recurvatus]
MTHHEPKNLEEFKKLINQDKLVVVDFYATWCGPCKLIAPKFAKFAETYSDAVYVKVDVDEVPDVASEYGIRAMPTIMYFKNGAKVDEVVGANVAAIEKKIKELL